MFQSTFTIFITSVITFLVILTICLRQNPFTIVVDFLRDLFRIRMMMVHVLLCLGILAINKMELLLEPSLDKTEDWTPYIRAFEGNITPLFQHWFDNVALTYVTTYFYVIVFSVLMACSLLIYHREKDYRSMYTLLYSIGLNYLLAIPFFLFAPVSETWYYHPDIQFLIPSVYPGFESGYRSLSGLDNSFPSLHTSISITLALIAWQSVNRPISRITSLSAAVVLFAILYLGIHWYLDIITGAVLALTSVALAFRFSEIPLGKMSTLSSQQASEHIADIQ
ncbi:phosphatase PAP2 family protein [Marininema halotolerans]|uniref:PAP2 superfamily protein n=1 Tax=Marininema halotolerans TaxID=1155944 RepID=A0A1I6R1T3_9BACL|nr:phosphatase PAP2 family protein [Marininema halotolerans]SFS58669.1 PAP2 superfamily protein [Marininema halotolerans]